MIFALCTYIVSLIDAKELIWVGNEAKFIYIIISAISPTDETVSIKLNTKQF